MSLRTTLIIIIVCHLTHLLDAQYKFIQFADSGFNKKLGKSWYYGTDFSRGVTKAYQSMDISLKRSRSENPILQFDTINGFPQIIALHLSGSGMFSPKGEHYETLPISRLEHIRFVDLSSTKSDKTNYEEYFEEMLHMPKLEGLLLPEYYKANLADYSNADSLLQKLSCIGWGSACVLPDGIYNLSAASVSFNQPDLINELNKCNSESLKHLRISTDSITTAVLEKIASFSKLESLILSYKRLEKEALFIPHLKKLKSLTNFKTSQLKLVDFNQLDSLSELTYLKITIDSLQGLDISPIMNLPLLTNLQISSYRKGSKILWSSNSKPPIRHFKINGNIIAIDSKLGNLTELERLDLSYNDIESLPGSIENLQRLKILHLNGNNLKELPDELVAIRQLEDIQLHRNSLTTLPNDFGNLTNLKTLNCGYNRIHTLPSSIGNCIALNSLNLGNNMLLELPEEVYNCTELVHLTLRNNRLQNLPNGISKLEKLKSLFVGNNNYSLDKNDTLTIYNNDIHSFPSDFHLLNSIEKLHINDNENLDDAIVLNVLNTSSSSLSANLSSCGIEKIPETGWKNTKLQQLLLKGNKISFLPSEVYFTNIKTLSFRGNQLGQMNMSFDDPRQLRVHAFLNGIISKEELLNYPDILEGIMQVASKNYYKDQKNPILDIYPIAFEIDSIKTSSLIDHENYADELFKAERFEECIPHYTIAINQDLARCLIVTNFIVPKIYNRHKAYLETGDTIAAIHDLAYLQEEFSTPVAGDAAILSLQIGDTTNYQQYIDMVIDYFEVMEYRSAGDDLSLLECYLIKGQPDKYISFRLELNTSEYSSNYLKILEYLDAINQYLYFDNEDSIQNFKLGFNSSDYTNKRWNCELLNEALSIQYPDKINAVIELSNLICPN